MAEIFVPKKDVPISSFVELCTKRKSNSENQAASASNKRRKAGKDSEIQGALALIELARN